MLRKQNILSSFRPYIYGTMFKRVKIKNQQFKEDTLALFPFKHLVFNPFQLFFVGWHLVKKVYTKKTKVNNKRLQNGTRS